MGEERNIVVLYRCASPAQDSAVQDRTRPRTGGRRSAGVAKQRLGVEEADLTAGVVEDGVRLTDPTLRSTKYPSPTGIGWSVRLPLILLTFALSAAVVQPDADERALAYSLAYSGYVAHACPGWEQHLEALPAGFLPTAATFGSVWSEGTPRQEAYRKGGRDAAADRRADARFCEHPVDRRAEKAPPLRSLISDRRTSAPR